MFSKSLPAPIKRERVVISPLLKVEVVLFLMVVDEEAVVAEAVVDVAAQEAVEDGSVVVATVVEATEVGATTCTVLTLLTQTVTFPVRNGINSGTIMR
jgi:hypothetical protein